MMHGDFYEALRLAYNLSGLKVTDENPDAESQAYGAGSFRVDGLNVVFRVGKITPTKTGQFVTMWKRNDQGKTVPFSNDDPIDLFVFSVRKNDRFGQFVFSKKLLGDQGYITKSGQKGKMAMRLYPPWDVVTSPQAKKTQNWQGDFYVDIHGLTLPNLGLIRSLFLQNPRI